MDEMQVARWQNLDVRRWAVGLALLALFVQVLTPSGFMVGRQDGHAAIVICTGHGPAASLSDLIGHPAKAPQSRHDAPCVFAGFGVGAAPALAALIVRPIAPAPQPALLARLDLIPGRGLAAPPPPSQGPPQLTL
jgi:hypothetical protein